jgi:nucleoside-diphosphate-sugar epimerase
MLTTATREQTPRVLVTGSQGFTGRYVTARLQQAGYRVFGTTSASRPTAGGSESTPALYSLDLRDAEQTAQVVNQVQPHAVIHLAALAFVGHGNPADFYHVNVVGTRHLLQALAQSNAPLQKVVLASSANVYGNQHEGQLSEQMAPNPANDYAVSKVAMEHMAWLWADKLPLLITRPFNYTGVGQEDRYLIPKIVDHFRRRAPTIELGNVNVARDFSDVRAVAQAYHGLLESEALNQVVNLCSGTSHTLQGIIDLCSQQTGHTPDIAVNPAFVRANDVKVLYGDNTRLKQWLPEWAPIPMAQTLAWMLEKD